MREIGERLYGVANQHVAEQMKKFEEVLDTYKAVHPFINKLHRDWRQDLADKQKKQADINLKMEADSLAKLWALEDEAKTAKAEAVAALVELKEKVAAVPDMPFDVNAEFHRAESSVEKLGNLKAIQTHTYLTVPAVPDVDE